MRVRFQRCNFYYQNRRIYVGLVYLEMRQEITHTRYVTANQGAFSTRLDLHPRRARRLPCPSSPGLYLIFITITSLYFVLSFCLLRTTNPRRSFYIIHSQRRIDMDYDMDHTHYYNPTAASGSRQYDQRHNHYDQHHMQQYRPSIEKSVSYPRMSDSGAHAVSDHTTVSFTNYTSSNSTGNWDPDTNTVPSVQYPPVYIDSKSLTPLCHLPVLTMSHR
jgi:hypothetical protein